MSKLLSSWMLLMFMVSTYASPEVEPKETLPVDSLVLPDIQPVTVNGLIAGKAAVMIGGSIHLLSEGQTVGNVRLISADEYSALLDIDNEQKRFYLHQSKLADYSDDFISYSQNLTGEQSDILGHSSHGIDDTKSHILNVEPIEQFSDKVKFRIEYFYNASHGEHVTLSASCLSNGRSSGHSAHTYTKLNVGRNLVDIDIFMSPNAPERYSSESIKFEMIGGQRKNGSHQILSKLIPFEKEWFKDNTSPESGSSVGVIGNAEWKTVSQ